MKTGVPDIGTVGIATIRDKRTYYGKKWAVGFIRDKFVWDSKELTLVLRIRKRGVNVKWLKENDFELFVAGKTAPSASRRMTRYYKKHRKLKGTETVST